MPDDKPSAIEEMAKRWYELLRERDPHRLAEHKDVLHPEPPERQQLPEQPQKVCARPGCGHEVKWHVHRAGPGCATYDCSCRCYVPAEPPAVPAVSDSVRRIKEEVGK